MESDIRSAFLAAPLALLAVPAPGQLAGPPEVLLSATAQRGDAFAFQLWFRDEGSSNTSSAVVVRFR